MIGRVIVAAVLAALVLPAAAQADWSGDFKGDVVGVGSDGRLLLYKGDGAGHFAGPGQGIGTGWNRFNLVFTPGDFSGDGRGDLLARQPDGGLFMYRGNGKGGFVTGADEKIGSGWQSFTALVANGDWNGDGHADLLARTSDGVLYLYRGDGDSGFITGQREQIGTGWQGFTALLAAGDWSGDGKPDLLARTSAGALLLYRGTGTGGFQTGNQQIGSGWQGFTALFSGGDFSGDGKQDILARNSDGVLFMYRGNGTGGFVTGEAEQIGTGWNSLSSLMLISGGPPPPPPAPPAPPAAPLPDGRVRLQAGLRCTPPGGLLKVGLKVRRRSGRAAPRVRRVVFFVRGGARKIDRRRPYTVRLRINRPAGQTGRVYARVVFKRKGTRKLRRKTVSRRFVMCG